MPDSIMSFPDDLHERLKNHPEIRWSEVARQSIHQWMSLILKLFSFFPFTLSPYGKTALEVEKLDI